MVWRELYIDMLMLRNNIFIIIDIIHRFYVALFSALEQTHCTRVACESE